MPNQRALSLKILAATQAVASGLIAGVIFVLYGLKPSLLKDTGVSLTAAILGVAGVVYFGTLHQVLSRKHQALSTLMITIISATNIVLVIASTGGLDSPYYSLWLLAVVVAGIFGKAEIIGVIGVTLLYYFFALATEGMHGPNLRDHVVQLGITLIAGGLAWWVQGRDTKDSADNNQVSNLTGQLSAAQIKADTIINSMGEGVMVIDAGRKIQIFNNAAQQLTGWDSDSAASIDCDAVLRLKTPDDQPVNDINDPFTEAWRKSTTVIRDNLSITSRAGRKKQVSLSISPVFNNRHEPSGAIVLVRDISHEKEVEREKNEFISTASHEMRTPVAAIEGYISLAMNPNVATIDDRAKKYLEKSHETISHLGQLFKDLLSVTKAEEGVVGGKIGAVNLGQLLQATVDDMQFAAGKKKLTLVFQIGGTSGKAIAPLYYVASNAERLREVMENLIDNALKFSTEGGVKVSLEGSDKEVTVGVSDTGMGISAEDIPHLFQKFYRVDNGATRTIGGTGLGLYLCRRVIEAFNGRIWVESKLGQGSTFRFSLPRLSEAEVERLQSSTTVQPETSEDSAQGATTPTPTAAPSPLPEPKPRETLLPEPESLAIPTEETPPSVDEAPAATPSVVQISENIPAGKVADAPGFRVTDITMRRRIG